MTAEVDPAVAAAVVVQGGRVLLVRRRVSEGALSGPGRVSPRWAETGTTSSESTSKGPTANGGALQRIAR